MAVTVTGSAAPLGRCIAHLRDLAQDVGVTALIGQIRKIALKEIQ